jgi:UDP-N-acetyl-D-glucosamine dehydrogenase
MIAAPEPRTSMPQPIDDLEQRLSSDSPRVGIVGLGYVGLPLAVALAQTGARVAGVDVSDERARAVSRGISHVGDVASSELEPLVGGSDPRLRATTDFDALQGMDAVIICVPTPLRRTKDPDISHVVEASTQVAKRARPGQLVVLESTTYPGTTEDVLVPLLRERGLEPGRDACVAFSPERVDPGNRTYGLRNTPKVVGGVTPRCTRAASSLYQRTCDRIVAVSSPAAAETVKLLENTFRSVNIGLVNEFALICRRLGLDVWEVIDAASTKPFGFMRFTPGPGLGGHCIPVDPHYLAWKLRSLNFSARFIELADAINSAMPDHVVSVLMDALNDRGRALRGARVLVLGVTYKPDVADVRESPALHVLALLQEKGAAVSYNDPYVPELESGGELLHSVEAGADALAEADAVVIVTNHACYEPDAVARAARLIVDTRNFTAPAVAREPGLTTKIYRI